MKTCSKCKRDKDKSQFGKYSKSKDGLFPMCKSCKREYDNESYRMNPGRKKSIVASNERRRQERLLFIGDYLMNHPCVDCGNTDIRVLEFDHVRGEKLGNVGSMAQNMTPMDRLMEEMSKCDVRCANCHRIITVERAGSWRSLWV